MALQPTLTVTVVLTLSPPGAVTGERRWVSSGADRADPLRDFQTVKENDGSPGRGLCWLEPHPVRQTVVAWTPVQAREGQHSGRRSHASQARAVLLGASAGAAG